MRTSIEKGYRAVNYSKISLMLLQALKEENARVTEQQGTVVALQQDVEALWQENQDLTDRLAALERLLGNRREPKR